MSEDSRLEARYRRLLAFYPSAFRREHEQEMLSVLMAGAVEGQRWPRAAEAADLLASAACARLRSRLRRFWAFEYRHRRVTVPVRVLVGLWLVALTAILWAYDRDRWLAALLVPAAALHFYVAYRSLRHPIER